MKGLLLLSGGFDSVVAGFLLKDKMDLIAIHFSHQPFTDEKAEQKAAALGKMLGVEKFLIAKAGNAFSELAKNCNQKLYFVLSKRMMYRVAEQIAKKEGCDALITGENLGQVSSQVLDNLKNLDNAVQMQVLRPLVCYDKTEIINLARKFETYETSCGPEVCDILGPKHPATTSEITRIKEQEEKVNIDQLMDEIVNSITSEVEEGESDLKTC